MSKVLLAACLLSLSASSVAVAQGGEWLRITGEQTLRSFMSTLKADRRLPSGEMSQGEYHADFNIHRLSGGLKAIVANLWVCSHEKAKILHCQLWGQDLWDGLLGSGQYSQNWLLVPTIFCCAFL